MEPHNSFFQTFITPALLILAVIMLFNVMIFVHELGHFIVARWRGLYVDRFQIWFGKPLWKKKINGVEWGLGWIPAGGFVSLPQLAPMESIEGEVDPESVKEYLKKTGQPENGGKLPQITALDKILVAFSGPLFSFLLALLFAVGVWAVGKPAVKIENTTIGYINPGSPAEQAGFQLGDKIIAIDGHVVKEWIGNMEGVMERIMLSENPEITFTVLREGEALPVNIESSYRIPETRLWQRKAMRQVGLLHSSKAIVEGTLPDSPAHKAGLKKGDVILTVNGQKVWSPLYVQEQAAKGESISLTVDRPDVAGQLEITLSPVLPANAGEMENPKPMAGIEWGLDETDLSQTMEHPTPFSQIAKSLSWMKITLEKIFSRGSDVGVEHLAGPIGIATQFYNLLNAPHGWSLALWFAVVLNVNLAILNLLPFPVVDGGHIVLGFAEMVRGRPVSGKPLEFVQTGFVIVLLVFFLFVSSRDIGDLVGSGAKNDPVPRFSSN